MQDVSRPTAMNGDEQCHVDKQVAATSSFRQVDRGYVIQANVQAVCGVL